MGLAMIMICAETCRELDDNTVRVVAQGNRQICVQNL